MKAQVGLTDASRHYRYVVHLDSSTRKVSLWIPTYNPVRFNDDFSGLYHLHLGYWVGNIERTLFDKITDATQDTLAMKVERVGEDYYYESVEWDDEIEDIDENIYISLGILSSNGEDLDPAYSTGQGCFFTESPIVSWIPCIEDIDDAPVMSFSKFPLSELTRIGITSNNFTYKIKCYVLDNTDVYDRVTTDKVELPSSVDELATIPLNILLRKFSGNEYYKPGLKVQALINLYEKESDELFMTYRSVPYILTPDTYARIQADCSDDRWTDPDAKEIDDILKDMNIYKPTIINTTVKQVIEIDSVDSSKQHIIQPVFFRTRELGNCIFHPEVTENICLNLDAYKSQVESFRLRLEGIVFSESARTQSGVIFKIEGNLLPGDSDSGTYYILNEKSELVTTGKYTYEY